MNCATKQIYLYFTKFFKVTDTNQKKRMFNSLLIDKKVENKAIFTFLHDNDRYKQKEMLHHNDRYKQNSV